MYAQGSRLLPASSDADNCQWHWQPPYGLLIDVTGGSPPVLTLLLRTSFSTERETHSSGGFGSVRRLRSFRRTSFSFFVICSRWSRCCFQEGTTISIRNLFGCFKSSYKCHLYAPFCKKISRASHINSMHSFRRVGSTLNSAAIDTGPSLGAGCRLGSRL